MFDFFEKILGFIETVFEFFINLVESLFMAIEVLAKAVVFPIELSGLMPSILGSAMLIVVSLAVVKFIVGR